MINEATIPPNIKKNDPGLLTLDQYMEMRNPGGKMHPSHSYSGNLDWSNYTGIISREIVRMPMTGDWSLKTGGEIEDIEFNGDIKAFIHDGTIVYNPRQFPTSALDAISERYTKERQVKYVDKARQETMDEIAKEKNLSTLTKPFKRIKLKDKYFTFHIDDHSDIVVLSDGLVVGMASNEWGATLVQVSPKVRGYGLGPILASEFIDKFNLPSGGYTPAGEANATKIWSNRVREFISSGWYPELISNGTMTNEQVKKIIADFKKVSPKTTPKIPSKESPKEESMPLVYIDDDNVAMVVYKEEFYESRDEKDILAHAFFRTAPDGQNILYTIDYDNDKARKLISYVALQIARDEGFEIDIEFPGGDYFNYDDLKFTKVKDGKLILEKDVLNISDIKRLERIKRKPHDPHKEIEYLLLELAESKY